MQEMMRLVWLHEILNKELKFLTKKKLPSNRGFIVLRNVLTILLAAEPLLEVFEVTSGKVSPLR